jgi:hypothetical protein
LKAAPATTAAAATAAAAGPGVAAAAAAEGEQPLVRLIRDVMARVVNDTEAGGDFLRAALGT